jgi:hypothetical protein
MPIMNGYEAIKIREFNEDVINYTKRIHIYGRSWKAIKMGGNGYISKPIDKK